MKYALRPVLRAVIAGALCAAAGCEIGKTKVKYPGEVRRIEPGMPQTKAVNLIGAPMYINYGVDQHVGRDVWVYEKGYLVVYRTSVKTVVPVRDASELPPPEQPEDPFVTTTRAYNRFANPDDEDFYRRNRVARGVVRADEAPAFRVPIQ